MNCPQRRDSIDSEASYDSIEEGLEKMRRMVRSPDRYGENIWARIEADRLAETSGLDNEPREAQPTKDIAYKPAPRSVQEAQARAQSALIHSSQVTAALLAHIEDTPSKPESDFATVTPPPAPFTDVPLGPQASAEISFSWDGERSSTNSHECLSTMPKSAPLRKNGKSEK